MIAQPLPSSPMPKHVVKKRTHHEISNRKRANYDISSSSNSEELPQCNRANKRRKFTSPLQSTSPKESSSLVSTSQAYRCRQKKRTHLEMVAVSLFAMLFSLSPMYLRECCCIDDNIVLDSGSSLLNLRTRYLVHFIIYTLF